MSQIASQEGAHKVRFDMVTRDDNWLFAEYSSFSIRPETDKYRWSVSGYSGTAGNRTGSGNMTNCAYDIIP